MTPYNAEISAGSLMPLESKRVAGLLLTEPDNAAWLQAIEVDNILQKDTCHCPPSSKAHSQAVDDPGCHCLDTHIDR
jgi:hypothetical protein